MKINTPKGTNLAITNDISDYLLKKVDAISKIADSLDPSSMMDVELERTTTHHEKGEIYRAEFNLTVNGKMYRSEEYSTDIMSAIDLSKDAILRELRSHKDRDISIVRRSGLAIKNILRGAYDWPIRRLRSIRIRKNKDELG